MKKVTFRELYGIDYEITDIFATRQKWKKGVLFTKKEPRENCGMIFLNGCVGVYTDCYGKSFEAPEKSVVFLPAESTYSVLNKDCGLNGVDTYWLEFNILINGEKYTVSDKPEKIDSYLCSEIIKNAVESFEAPVCSFGTVKGYIYSLISYLGKEMINSYGKKFQSISKAIEIMENDPLCDLSIEEIARISNVSGGCFRKLFKEYSGKSPMQYRMDIKIGRAKNILLNSCFSIEEISETLGFENSAYFCKIFKKKTGLTPSDFRKKQIGR